MKPQKHLREVANLARRCGASEVRFRIGGKHIQMDIAVAGQVHTLGVPHAPKGEHCWRRRIQSQIKHAMRKRS